MNQDEEILTTGRRFASELYSYKGFTDGMMVASHRILSALMRFEGIKIPVALAQSNKVVQFLKKNDGLRNQLSEFIEFKGWYLKCITCDFYEYQHGDIYRNINPCMNFISKGLFE